MTNNKLTFKPAIIGCAFIVLFSSTANAYEAGDIVIRAGVANVSPDASSSNISINGNAVEGTGVDVDDDTQLGIIGTYFLTNKLGVSVLASTPFKHDAIGENIGINDIGSAKQLPPTVTLDYFPLNHTNKLQPHIGAGFNYTVFYSESTSSEFESAFGDSSLDLDDSFGLALKAGLDYQINDKFGINATVFWIDIDTDATINTFDGSVINVDIEVDPFVYIISASYKF